MCSYVLRLAFSLFLSLSDLSAVSITVIFRLAKQERRIPTLKLAFAATTEVESKNPLVLSVNLKSI